MKSKKQASTNTHTIENAKERLKSSSKNSYCTTVGIIKEEKIKSCEERESKNEVKIQ